MKPHLRHVLFSLFSMQTVSTKRKGPSSSGLPAKKKPRKKKESLDEETLVALALSSSLLEQEKEQQREKETQGRLQMETPVLKWWPDAGTEAALITAIKKKSLIRPLFCFGLSL